MRRAIVLVGLVVVALAGCTSPGTSDGSAPRARQPGTGSVEAPDTGAPEAGEAPAPVSSGPGLTYDQAKTLVNAYKKAHTGNGGKDWDVNAKSASQISADPDLQKLLSLCGQNQRPVIPILAWEYGGNDHQWVHPERSALVYCVYTPVKKQTDHWKYDAAKNHVTVDVYVRFPDQNPCKDRAGTEQVDACMGDPSNYEILVDTASLNDGKQVGLDLADSSTALWLVFPDNTKDLLANFD